MRAIIRSGFFGGLLSFTSDQKKPQFSPSNNPNEVLVKVDAAAINPVDYKAGKLLGPICGIDFSGTIEEVGEKVADFKVGDAVFGAAKTGSLADYCIAPADKIAKKSDTLSFVEAASLPVAYGTALQGLKIGNVKDGSSVLVIGASGGCGIAALHLCKALNAGRITAICSNKNGDLVKEAGATEVIDYTNERGLQTFFTENCGKFDCVYDTATGSGKGEYYTERGKAVLAKETGEYIQLNGGASTWARKVTGTLSKHQHLILTELSRSNLEEVTALLEKSGAKPHVNTMPFTEEGVNEGFDMLKSRRTRGKIVFGVTS